MSDVASQKRSDLVHSSSTSSFFLLANTSGVWLLWMSITLDVVLLSLGFHWFVAKSVAVVPFIKWFLETVDLSIVVKNFLFWVTEIFFKSFDIGGADNVPIEGPVIFACAPHNNQFIDGIVAMRALNARKDVGFIAAASSCRKPYEGKIIKLLGSIPVERPQDVASVGVGTLRFDPAKRVVAGKGTKFSSQVRKGDTCERSPANVVGTLCENNDWFAKDRSLPSAAGKGDLFVIHDSGAHSHSMGFQYNGKLRAPEVLLRKDGHTVSLIRHRETIEGLYANCVDIDI